MKKHLSKITAIVSAVFGLVFIVLLICTAFGGLNSADFDNKLVKILLFVFGGCYLAITVTAIALQFSDKIAIKDIQVTQGASGNIKVTPSVIRKLIRKNIKVLHGIKFGQMNLSLTEFGVQISLTVYCSSGRKAQETGTFLQSLIADICKNELDLEFRTINIKVIGFKSVYSPDIAKIEAETQAMLNKEPEFQEQPEPSIYGTYPNFSDDKPEYAENTLADTASDNAVEAIVTEDILEEPVTEEKETEEDTKDELF